MGYVSSRTFCCCIPVRFGVFMMTALGIVGGSIVAAVGWHGATHKDQAHLTRNQETSLVIASLSYTVLAIVSIFGLIGTIGRRRGFVSLYNTMVWWHLGFSIASGAYFIYTLFHKVGDHDVNDCINGSDSPSKQEDCRKAFKVGRNITIGLYIFIWLIELWGCLIVANYVEQLQEEEALDYPPPAQVAASTPPMATTYNYGTQYAFAQPENSFGRGNASNVELNVSRSALSQAVCTDCGGTVIEYDAAAGNGFCVQCGTVVEENTIVNEVSFGETASGAAMVQGSYVGQGATHARMGGPFGNRGNAESREQTIANANRKIQSIASILRLSDVVSLAATRLYTLAVEHKFTKGRKSLNVVAVCLYVACRQKETRNYMLIDFSDLLQVNVFELGHTYLQLVQTLNLRLPLVDPSHYISRFAALLEFGDETHKVATDAIRLVQRFDRDWMTKGRRPAGICGACLLLAARMNNFRRSVEEIVQVVKIADTTLRKRLKEFKETPSGALTLTDFRTVWLEEEMDPPAFIKGKEKERDNKELEVEDEASEEANKVRKKQNKADKRKRKRRRIDESDEEGGDNPPPSNTPRTYLDPGLFNSGILAGTSQPDPLFLPEPEPEEEKSEDQTNSALLVEQPPGDSIISSSSQAITTGSVADAVSPLEAEVNHVLAEEVAEYLLNEQGAQLSAALDEVNERRMAGIQPVDELIGLDEEELDRFLLSEEEVRVKERVWVEMNREYLEAIAAKGEQREPGGTSAKQKKRRKPTVKPRDASTPHGSTAAESVRTLLKQNARYSKRINYDALKDLFTDGKDEKDDDGILYTLDDKEEDASVVVEEGGGRIGGHAGLIDGGDLQPDPDDADDGDGSEKGHDYVDGSWEDTYEQEV
ncbi:hypothetical protein B0F90DRAFT_1668430 [Multifurca ochricompacta]|uniref:B-related factor 1 n=1 Tax=Multifurca ochricompacta TaxID=376703 RepID=A0AAD4M573_9AGAM|nr:hypothetical protein B0F90DRAFT_1668430 [Multifurca ochricompacta]